MEDVCVVVDATFNEQVDPDSYFSIITNCSASIIGRPYDVRFSTHYADFQRLKIRYLQTDLMYNKTHVLS